MTRCAGWVAAALVLGWGAAACGGSSSSDESPASGGAAGAVSDAGVGATAGSGGVVGGGGASSGGGAPSGGGMAGAGTGGVGTGGVGAGGTIALGRCSDPTPAGAAEPPPPPQYSGSACPKLAPGVNSIATKGGTRSFKLVMPAAPQAGEKLPLIFLWHWLKGKAQDFIDKAEVQKAVDAQRFIAVVPEQKGDLLFVWPVEIFQPDTRINEELTFFDDMYACADAQLPVNRSCVASTGVSAGALWTDQLAHRRSEYLSSFMSLSGGVGNFVIKPWATPKRAVPGMVLWGGPTDNCAGLFSFEALSKTLESDLTKSGNFFLECIHNCGHSEPPFPAGKTSNYEALWEFVFDHPYWLTKGQSPYITKGIPSAFPEWCGIGKNSATPRVGACIDGSKC